MLAAARRGANNFFLKRKIAAHGPRPPYAGPGLGGPGCAPGLGGPAARPDLGPLNPPERPPGARPDS
jgi:hypothetical protein